MTRRLDDLQEFLTAIESKFFENEEKGSWKGLSDSTCLERLQEEVLEMIVSRNSNDWPNTLHEAADVALFAYFYADKERV